MVKFSDGMVATLGLSAMATYSQKMVSIMVG